MASKPSVRPRTGMSVPCDECGKLHYRKPHVLARRSKSGLRYCSRSCQHAQSKRVNLVCDNCGQTYVRFKSQARRGARSFCSKSCYDAHGLSSIRCMWPGCTEDLACRVQRAASRLGEDTYKINLIKRGSYTRFVLCREHRDLAAKHLGRSIRLTAGRSLLLRDPNARFSMRAASGGLLRLICFERSRGRCEQCEKALEFKTRANNWQLDHKTPVFKGGVTSLANLQVLCTPCHDTKSCAEKSEANLTRHVETRAGRWLTHQEKDELIARLKARLREAGLPEE